MQGKWKEEVHGYSRKGYKRKKSKRWHFIKTKIRLVSKIINSKESGLPFFTKASSDLFEDIFSETREKNLTDYQLRTNYDWLPDERKYIKKSKYFKLPSQVEVQIFQGKFRKNQSVLKWTKKEIRSFKKKNCLSCPMNSDNQRTIFDEDGFQAHQKSCNVMFHLNNSFSKIECSRTKEILTYGTQYFSTEYIKHNDTYLDNLTGKVLNGYPIESILIGTRIIETQEDYYTRNDLNESYENKFISIYNIPKNIYYIKCGMNTRYWISKQINRSKLRQQERYNKYWYNKDPDWISKTSYP